MKAFPFFLADQQMRIATAACGFGATAIVVLNTVLSILVGICFCCSSRVWPRFYYIYLRLASFGIFLACKSQLLNAPCSHCFCIRISVFLIHFVIVGANVAAVALWTQIVPNTVSNRFRSYCLHLSKTSCSQIFNKHMTNFGLFQ